MTQYIIVYPGGDQAFIQEEGKQNMGKYMEWLSALWDSTVSPANPLKNMSRVNSDGKATTGGTTTMSGYTIIDVDSMVEAYSIAKDCPFLDISGSLEFSEIMQMPGKNKYWNWVHLMSKIS